MGYDIVTQLLADMMATVCSELHSSTLVGSNPPLLPAVTGSQILGTGTTYFCSTPPALASCAKTSHLSAMFCNIPMDDVIIKWPTDTNEWLMNIWEWVHDATLLGLTAFLKVTEPLLLSYEPSL